jgi:hypothetical protein
VDAVARRNLPGPSIGFAGPRVIEQTIRQAVPAGFQRAEFLLEKGFLDAVLHRRDLKAYLIRALDFLKTPAAAWSPLSCLQSSSIRIGKKKLADGCRFPSRPNSSPLQNSHAAFAFPLPVLLLGNSCSFRVP